MIYDIHLHDEPFNLIKNGLKKYELRLNDEKRKIYKIGDVLNFTNRTTLELVSTKIVDLLYFDSFDSLYKSIDNSLIGYKKGIIANPKDMEIYYSKEEQKIYGVVAIKIELLK